MESKDTWGGCQVYRGVNLCTTKLHLMTESVVTTLYGFDQWVPYQCKNVLFQHTLK